MSEEELIYDSLNILLEYSNDDNLLDTVNIIKNEELKSPEKQKQLSKKYWNRYTKNVNDKDDIINDKNYK